MELIYETSASFTKELEEPKYEEIKALEEQNEQLKDLLVKLADDYSKDLPGVFNEFDKMIKELNVEGDVSKAINKEFNTLDAFVKESNKNLPKIAKNCIKIIQSLNSLSCTTIPQAKSKVSEDLAGRKQKKDKCTNKVKPVEQRTLCFEEINNFPSVHNNSNEQPAHDIKGKNDTEKTDTSTLNEKHIKGSESKEVLAIFNNVEIPKARRFSDEYKGYYSQNDDTDNNPETSKSKQIESIPMNKAKGFETSSGRTYDCETIKTILSSTITECNYIKEAANKVIKPLKQNGGFITLKSMTPRESQGANNKKQGSFIDSDQRVRRGKKVIRDEQTNIEQNMYSSLNLVGWNLIKVR